MSWVITACSAGASRTPRSGRSCASKHGVRAGSLPGPAGAVAYPLHRMRGVTGVRRRYPIGAELMEGGVHFRVWAPAAKKLTLVLESPEPRELALRAEDGGYHSLLVDTLTAGVRIRRKLNSCGLRPGDAPSGSQTAS